MTDAECRWNDEHIQAAIGDELVQTREVDASRIGIAVNSGIVTVSGEVGDYEVQSAVLHAVARVDGVTTTVDDIVVHPGWSSIVTEPDIAREVARALRAAEGVPATVKAEIKNHDVTLTGSVGSFPERSASEDAVKHLQGVNYVANRITLLPRASANDVTHRIQGAFVHQAQINAAAIAVAVVGNTVTLTGTVGTTTDRDDAERAARSSPNVTGVEVGIVVRAERQVSGDGDGPDDLGATAKAR